MKTVYLNDYQIHSNSVNIGTYIQRIQGLDFPTMRSSEYDKPGEYGGVLANQLYGGRRITITGFIEGNNIEEYEQRRRGLQNALGIIRDVYSIPQPITLKFTTMDDLALQTDVYARDFKMDVQNVLSAAFMIDLYSPKYELSSQSLNIQAVSVAGGGGAVYPVIYPVTYAVETGGSVTITNSGSVEIFPTIYLNGPLNNPIIQNTTNNRYISLNLTLGSSDQIIISMDSKKIILNGNQSVISNKVSGSLFWWLEKGENIIKLLTSSGGDTGNAQVQWRNGFLGA